MSNIDPIELKRIQWRSRRGLLEMDLVLEKFLAGPIHQLPPEGVEAYRRLLELVDTDFLDIVNGKADVDDPEEMAIIAILRAL